MLILPYDTETTGMPVWKEPSEHPDQPHLVEIAALLVDEETMAVRDVFSAIIRPDGWKWDENDEAFKAHGITFEQAMDTGIPEARAVEQFIAMHEQANIRVAHNESFDARILRIALKRYGLPMLTTQEQRDALADRYKAAPAYCTCNHAKPIMRLPATAKMRATGRGSWFKPPNLDEAHQHFFQRPHEGAHRALADADACGRLYLAMIGAQGIPEHLLGPAPAAELPLPTSEPIPDCPQPETPIGEVVYGRGPNDEGTPA